jgi:hypothetical protein
LPLRPSASAITEWGDFGKTMDILCCKPTVGWMAA